MELSVFLSIINFYVIKLKVHMGALHDDSACINKM